MKDVSMPAMERRFKWALGVSACMAGVSLMAGLMVQDITYRWVLGSLFAVGLIGVVFVPLWFLKHAGDEDFSFAPHLNASPKVFWWGLVAASVLAGAICWWSENAVGLAVLMGYARVMLFPVAAGSGVKR